MLRIWLVIGLDLLFKDPKFLYHPVQFFGFLIEKGEALVRSNFKEESLRKAGIILVLGVISLVLLIYMSLKVAIGLIHPLLATAFDLYLSYALIASGSLMEEGKRIYAILKSGDLEDARKSLSYLVSRDTSELTLKDILRGAVETLSENITDGIISPLFYYGLIGVPALLMFKVVSTFDSMIGYKNEKYLNLGRFAAKLDDAFNFFPARLAGVLVIVAAFVTGEDYKNAYKIFRRDRLNHASPNSACTESAVAGALNIKLGGNAVYFGQLVVKPSIGDGPRTEDLEVLPRTVKLIFVSTLLMGVALTLFYGLRGDFIGF